MLFEKLLSILAVSRLSLSVNTGKTLFVYIYTYNAVICFIIVISPAMLYLQILCV